MEKKIIKILTISKKPKSFYSLLTLFEKASEKKYDLIVYFSNEKKDYLEINLLRYDHISHRDFEEIFGIIIKRDEEGYFDSFDILKTEKEFYQILKEKFQIEIRSLSEI